MFNNRRGDYPLSRDWRCGSQEGTIKQAENPRSGQEPCFVVDDPLVNTWIEQKRRWESASPEEKEEICRNGYSSIAEEKGKNHEWRSQGYILDGE